ncbi:hypothetical protein OG762_49605 (plasmid) [Streptomyces sp. NBC_01136]|uniref:hypothetical protein n=1 Tax=unclassified Streptomyces TaxID=2593676 RepID=UPI002F91BD6C|nr:hypothetical protein OG762_49605 [Streptomyces sp. NBC_01136]
MQSINGTHKPHRRADILARFADADRGVLTNAQVLGEGVGLIWNCQVLLLVSFFLIVRNVRHDRESVPPASSYWPVHSPRW